MPAESKWLTLVDGPLRFTDWTVKPERAEKPERSDRPEKPESGEPGSLPRGTATGNG